MIDSHCHLADDVFAADVEATIARARAAGVSGALCILDAGNEVEVDRARQLSEVWPELRFSVGVTPHQSGSYASDPSVTARLVERHLDAMGTARAVGEIGLDYYYDHAPRETQQRVFRAQLRVAVERGLPVVIHAREADEDVLRTVEDVGQGRLQGVFHCFTSSEAIARRVVDLGFHIGIGGIVTFPKGENVRRVAVAVPLTRLLVETDSPFLAPVPYRGKRNEPAWVVRVAEALAALHAVSVAELDAVTTRAYGDVFRP